MFLSEADQLYKICSVLGTPSQHTWPEGLQRAASIYFQFPQVDRWTRLLLSPRLGSRVISNGA
jgi:hypothetical protein